MISLGKYKVLFMRYSFTVSVGLLDVQNNFIRKRLEQSLVSQFLLTDKIQGHMDKYDISCFNAYGALQIVTIIIIIIILLLLLSLLLLGYRERATTIRRRISSNQQFRFELIARKGKG